MAWRVAAMAGRWAVLCAVAVMASPPRGRPLDYAAPSLSLRAKRSNLLAAVFSPGGLLRRCAPRNDKEYGMAEFDLVIRNGTVATAADTTRCDLAIKDGTVVA